MGWGMAIMLGLTGDMQGYIYIGKIKHLRLKTKACLCVSIGVMCYCLKCKSANVLTGDG